MDRLAHRFFYIIPPPYIFRKPGESRIHYYYRKYLKKKILPPIGGVKIILQHCDILNKSGYRAFPVYSGNYTIKYHEHNTPRISLKQALKMMREEDIVIIPEMMPYAIEQFKCKTRIAFIQLMTGDLLKDSPGAAPRFEDLGYTHLLCVSDFLAREMLRYSSLPMFLVMNGIDLSAFKANPLMRENNRVTFLNRKNAEMAYEIIRKLNPEIKANARIVELDPVYTQSEMIEQYQQTDVFMATGFPEGFALPPLEAMACGCAVVGCTGGGGSQYMRDQETALVVPDGDVDGFVTSLEKILADDALKEKIRAAGIAEAQHYGTDRMEADLVAFTESICKEASSL